MTYLQIVWSNNSYVFSINPSVSQGLYVQFHDVYLTCGKSTHTVSYHTNSEDMFLYNTNRLTLIAFGLLVCDLHFAQTAACSVNQQKRRTGLFHTGDSR